MCRIDVEGSEGWLNRSEINPERVRHSMMYGVPLDCMWIIRVKEGWKVRDKTEEFERRLRERELCKLRRALVKQVACEHKAIILSRRGLLPCHARR